MTSVFVRYALVGVATAVLYFAVLIGLVEGMGLPAGSSSVIAYVGAIAFNYFFQKRFAFRSRSRHWITMVRYFLLVVALVGLNALALTVLPNLLGISYLAVQALVAVVTVAISFLSQRLWVFAR